MKQNSRYRLYVFFLVLQILTLFGCGKLNHAPVFGGSWEMDNSKTMIIQKMIDHADKGVPAFVSQSKSKHRNSNTYKKNDYRIVIDPGHQQVPDYVTEPIGPGASKRKARVSTGCRGTKTGIPEYKLNLTMAMKLKDYLTKEGYRVILTRETNEVNISNKQRTAFANEIGASLLLHIHCSSSDNEKLSGPLAMCPTRKSPYCKDIYEESKKACDEILGQICRDTDMKNNGLLETDYMAGINYSKVPVCYLELGYLSNEEDERKLTDKEFEDHMVKSIAKGIDHYFDK